MKKMLIEKFDVLKEAGHFPYTYDITHNSERIKENFDELYENQDKKISTTGRILFKNKFGRLIFMRVQDQSGMIQWMVSEKDVGKELFKIINKKVDIGDICGIVGKAYLTNKGEKTVNVQEFTVLSKCIRQLPEKYNKIADKGLIYKQREIDLIINRDSFNVFKTRSDITRHIRNWMHDKGFIEFETPTVQMVYGGAEAEPFITHVNAINEQAYLSIAPELHLKRLLVGGYEKVFTITKSFRNEGIDATHNPEFTTIEAYEAFSDYNDAMNLAENLLNSISQEIHNTDEIPYDGKTISFKVPFKRTKFYDGLYAHTGLNKDSSIKETINYVKENLKDENIDLSLSKIQLFVKIFDCVVEKTLIEPTFIIDHPKETSPLCRMHREDPDLIERFELYINGMEIANAYSELNDPVIQRNLLETQTKEASRNKEIPPMIDEAFITAIEYGMPPSGGLGIGIDRVVMIMTNQVSIRDVVLFPFVKTGNKKIDKKIDKKVSIENQTSTHKLFHDDMYQKEAKNIKVTKVLNNLVWLEKTIFYPESGGQEGDRGFINNFEVLDTIVDAENNNEIIHVLSDDSHLNIGDTVILSLNWKRRYKLMRLHSASHIMEHFLLEKFNLKRVGSHIDENKDISVYKEKDEIELDIMNEYLNKRVQEFINYNHEINIDINSDNYRLWKCSDIHEGCGGTHVNNTKEIGSLHIDIKRTKGNLYIQTILT